MNLKEAEAMVEKLLPEWSSTVSSNFDGFASLLLDDYEDWARDTLECVLDPCEDEFDRALDAWELVAVRYFTAMCRPVPSFKTADGVTCYVGIVSKYAFSNIGETFPESEEGAKALKWWTDREVSYKFTASGLVLYIGSYHSNWHDLKYIDYQAWDND